MYINKKTIGALSCAILAFGGSALLPVAAHASDLSKLGNAITYPVRKVGNNASVNTHRVLQKNSVEKSNGPAQNQIVKPDGHKTPTGS